VRALRWLAGDPKPKPPKPGAAAAATAGAAPSSQLPALTFDAHSWCYKFAKDHPTGTVLIRSRATNDVIGESPASVLSSSGISIYDKIRGDIGEGHYWLQGRHGDDPADTKLTQAHPITIGNPVPLHLQQAANSIKSSGDAMAMVDQVASLFIKFEPLLDRLMGRGGGGSADSQLQAAMLDNFLNPPNPIEALVANKRLLAELGAPATAPAAPAAAGLGGADMLAQGLAILRALGAIPGGGGGMETAATATPTATPEPEQSASQAASMATDDPMGQMVAGLLVKACHSNNPERIADACIRAYNAAMELGAEHPLLRQFPHDPGAVFDQFKAALVQGGQIQTPPEVMAAARELIVNIVTEQSAEGEPVDAATAEPGDITHADDAGAPSTTPATDGGADGDSDGEYTVELVAADADRQEASIV